MFKPSFAKVIIAGLLLGAGSVQAASAFPSAAEEVPAAWYAHTIKAAPGQGAVLPGLATFPSEAHELGSAHETYVEARPSGTGASIMGTLRAMFPSSSDEATPPNL